MSVIEADKYYKVNLMRIISSSNKLQFCRELRLALIKIKFVLFW